MKLTFVTPEKKIALDIEVSEVTVPGFMGELNILPGHAPLMTILEPGRVRYSLTTGEEGPPCVISWGYCQVSSSAVILLAESASMREDLDVRKMEENEKESLHRLSTEFLTDAQWDQVHKDLGRIQAEKGLLKGGSL